MSYKKRWLQRAVQADCYLCGGDINNHAPKPMPCLECVMTGIEPIPWTELFSHDVRLSR